jgi:hypothetical protein
MLLGAEVAEKLELKPSQAFFFGIIAGVLLLRLIAFCARHLRRLFPYEK